MRQTLSPIQSLVALALLFLGGALVAHMSWQDQVVGLAADDAVYVMLADFFSPYSASTRAAAAFVAFHGTFPPGYPLALALFGAGSGNVYAAHVLTTLMALGGFALAGAYLRRAGATFWLAAAYMVILFLTPRSLLQHLELLSEPLYLVFSLAALLRYQTLAPEGDRRGVMMVAAFTAAAMLTRSAGIALVVAFVLWQIFAAGRQRYLSSLVVAVAPVVIWELIKHLVYVRTNVYADEMLASYPWRDPAALAAKLSKQLNELWTGWRVFMDVQRQPSSLPAAFALLAAALPALAQRIWAVKLDAVYFVLYMGMVLAWPYPDHTARFLYPVMPVVLFYAVLSIGMLPVARWRHAAHALLLGIIALGIFPSTGQILGKAMSPDEDMGAYARSRAYYASNEPLPALENNAWILGELAQAMRVSGELVPEGECVYTVHFEMFMFYGRRHARPPRVENVRDGTLATAGCKYLFVNWSTSHPYFRPGYPLTEPSLHYAVLYEHTGRSRDAPPGANATIAQLVRLLTPAEFEASRQPLAESPVGAKP